MKFSIHACFCLVVFLNVELGRAADSALEKLEKELDAIEHKRSLKDAMTKMKNLADMKTFMDKLEADLKKKHVGDKKDIEKRDVSSFKAAMDKLEKEMAEAAKKKAKRNIEQPLDELLDELKHGSKHDEVEKRSFRDAFYQILGYNKRQSSVADERAFKRMMLKNSLVSVLKNLVDENSYKKEVNDGNTCKDVRTDCKSLASYCKDYREKLEGVCDKTCGYCRECKDALPQSQCEARIGYCNEDEYVDRMRDACFKTCGYCKAPAPPKCSQTKYQCCWDKQTAKQNTEGTNCPSCKDQYKYVCETFKEDCMSRYMPGDFMRAHCPEKCNLCNGLCADNPKYAAYCEFWKSQLGWCRDPTQKENMRHFCPKTCAFC